MTSNDDLKARLARIETHVEHISKSVDGAEVDRKELVHKVDGVTDRVTSLEARAVSPKEVHQNSIETAITQALRAATGRLLTLAITAGALVASIVFGVLSLVVTGNP